jgi:mono/diheme cytochrome c family protein
MSLKQKAIITMMPVALAASAMFTAGAGTGESTFNATTTYKSKCTACHGAKAEKKFDPSKSDDELVQIILKGKKAEKPPNMPGYETKGIHAEQAKQLLHHMKSLRQ